MNSSREISLLEGKSCCSVGTFGQFDSMSIEGFCESKKGSVGCKVKKGRLISLFDFVNEFPKGLQRLSRVDEFEVLRRFWNISFIGRGIVPRSRSVGRVFDNRWGFKKTVVFWFGGVRIVSRRVRSIRC